VRRLSTIGLVVVFMAVPAVTAVALQGQALKVRYGEALEHAKAKDFERALEMAFKIVREDEFYYDAQVLRIALAVILNKTGSEDPRNLIRVAKGFVPLGRDIEQDVHNMVDSLNGASGPNALGPSENEIVVSPYVRKRIALVVGIGTFKDPKINPLSFASNDARELAKTLTAQCRFDDVRVLVDAEATRRNILTGLDNIARSAQPEDLVVIYVASHGSPQDLDSAGVNYIVAYDSEVDNLFATSYKMKDLLDDIQTRIPAQRVVAFLDTCYSGATFNQKPAKWVAETRGLSVQSSGPALDSIKNSLHDAQRNVRLGAVASGDGRRQQGIGRVIIASSRQNQQAWESESINHGYFTYYLIEALKRQGGLSVQNLFVYLSTEVPKAVKKDRNAEQNPTMVWSVEAPVNIYIKD
jgi:Caspase domain